jgi:hypothetical protein
MGVLTETRSETRAEGDGRRVESEGLSPGMVLGDRVFDKGMARPANVRLNRRRKVFALRRTEGRKWERLCPNPDRRRRRVGQVFRVNFQHGREK